VRSDTGERWWFSVLTRPFLLGVLRESSSQFPEAEEEEETFREYALRLMESKFGDNPF
jgi:hypothetical protein